MCLSTAIQVQSSALALYMCLALTLTSPPHHHPPPHAHPHHHDHLLLLLPPSFSLQRPFGAEAGGGIPQGQPRGSAGRLAGHFDRPQPLPRSVHQRLNAGRGASEIRAGRRASSGQAHSPELPEDPLLPEHVRRPPRAPLQPRHHDNYARIWLESPCYGAPADVHPRDCPLGHGGAWSWGVSTTPAQGACSAVACLHNAWV